MLVVRKTMGSTLDIVAEASLAQQSKHREQQDVVQQTPSSWFVSAGAFWVTSRASLDGACSAKLIAPLFATLGPLKKAKIERARRGRRRARPWALGASASFMSQFQSVRTTLTHPEPIDTRSNSLPLSLAMQTEQPT